ncbi:RNA polymerase sigma factor [Paraburkholderia sp. GAS42]|uniref:RNA polymerase sigma factor n=1 Tax=Paraburkholderia sp. GAS42 TaxID=3035135 RepID=UPI003D25CD83
MRQTETTATGNGDEAARSRRFQQLALPHLDAAFNLARWLSGNASDADDIVQEAYMRAFRFFDTFRGDNARPWLLAIVRRTWYTEWRRRASSREVAGFDDSQEEAAFDGWSEASIDPQALLIREEDTRRVHAALEKLPVEYREVLILRELEELSYREIAIVADLPVGTVMSRLARGRRRLALALTALEARGSERRHPDADGGRDSARSRQADASAERASARGASEGGWASSGDPGAAAAGANRETPDGL